MTGLEPPPPTADSEREAALAALAWPRRMSPVALVFGLGRRLRLAVRQFGLIVAVAALQAGGRLAILVVLGGVLVTAAVSALAW